MQISEMQLSPLDRLLVGLRGSPGDLLIAENICLRYDGVVIRRDGDTLITEFGSTPEILDEVLAKLPRATVTHVWRTGIRRVSAPEPRYQPVTQLPAMHFCGILR